MPTFADIGCCVVSETVPHTLYPQKLSLISPTSGGRSVGIVRLRTKPKEFLSERLLFSPHVTSSLTSGWVCRLQLLLFLARAVIFRSESHGVHDHISLSQILDFTTWRARFPHLYTPGTGWPIFTPKHCVSFTSPSTIRRATVEVFNTANWL
jgi:hypothetical protein